ncbi:hypothetical protein DFH06DRAFT_1309145 [Mycena polygramma]|nr:hypothetical protein DFH06DRAFT_1309145 [Mycena polygramma]
METTSVSSKAKSEPSLRVFVSDRGYIFREGGEDFKHVIAEAPKQLAWNKERTMDKEETMDKPTASTPGSEKRKQIYTNRCTIISMPPRAPVSLVVEVRETWGQLLHPDGTFDVWADCPYDFEANIYQTETTGHVHATFRGGEWRVHNELFGSKLPDDKPDLYTVTTAILATGPGRIPDPREWVRCWFTTLHQVETVSGSRIRPPEYAVKRLKHSWITDKIKCRFRRDDNTYTASQFKTVYTEKRNTTSQRCTVKVVGPVKQRFRQFVYGRPAERWSVTATVDDTKVPWDNKWFISMTAFETEERYKLVITAILATKLAGKPCKKDGGEGVSVRRVVSESVGPSTQGSALVREPRTVLKEFGAAQGPAKRAIQESRFHEGFP